MTKSITSKATNTKLMNRATAEKVHGTNYRRYTQMYVSDRNYQHAQQQLAMYNLSQKGMEIANHKNTAKIYNSLLSNKKTTNITQVEYKELIELLAAYDKSDEGKQVIEWRRVVTDYQLAIRDRGLASNKENQTAQSISTCKPQSDHIKPKALFRQRVGHSLTWKPDTPPGYRQNQSPGGKYLKSQFTSVQMAVAQEASNQNQKMLKEKLDAQTPTFAAFQADEDYDLVRKAAAAIKAKELDEEAALNKRLALAQKNAQDQRQRLDDAMQTVWGHTNPYIPTEESHVATWMPHKPIKKHIEPSDEQLSQQSSSEQESEEEKTIEYQSLGNRWYKCELCHKSVGETSRSLHAVNVHNMVWKPSTKIGRPLKQISDHSKKYFKSKINKEMRAKGLNRHSAPRTYEEHVDPITKDYWRKFHPKLSITLLKRKFNNETPYVQFRQFNGKYDTMISGVSEDPGLILALQVHDLRFRDHFDSVNLQPLIKNAFDDQGLNPDETRFGLKNLGKLDPDQNLQEDTDESDVERAKWFFDQKVEQAIKEFDSTARRYHDAAKPACRKSANVDKSACNTRAFAAPVLQKHNQEIIYNLAEIAYKAGYQADSYMSVSDDI